MVIEVSQRTSAYDVFAFISHEVLAQGSSTTLS
jgi:hypothetical protein